ncbi:hypothetical protein SCBWM1_gp147 [Synechococcus phage S-CBWM1]|uniref:Uncharacterized protein n=1 Tax=Synechococcus phage S-CBWM1 TaxID=2053653 RepID=A0A3G1L3R8_9CAUD|nr:DNA binding protein [Synechococcus phage S-CBWM1]ATW62831.1 hypothetical protein SCBWM1_gp147 [Synechococcus phage S-CBWM1]
MNIFAVDENPTRAAKDLPDTLVMKMPLECSQMFSSWAFNTRGIRLVKKDGGFYGVKGHANHPCTRWLYDKDENVSWLLRHSLALCAEYTERFGKTHACEITIRRMIGDLHWEFPPFEEHSPFVLCMPEAHKDLKDPVGSYRRFVNTEKGYADWKYGPEPEWWDWEINQAAKEKWVAERIKRRLEKSL